MAFGIYIHFPYCIQQCKYCNFVTLPYETQIKAQDYIQFLILEIKNRGSRYLARPVTSVFFGGGTPSLMNPSDIRVLLNELSLAGLAISEQTEITMEINPETMNHDRFIEFQDAGINRWSLGIQTLDPQLLKSLGREHSVKQSIEVMELFSKHNVNYNTDFIFGLPHQSMTQLLYDLKTIAQYSPSHVSSYFLSLPKKHSLNVGRPKDEVQIEMFYAIEKCLKSLNLQRYEISNFALKNRECRHNQIYWSDQAYWGIGVSAHSYEPKPKFGSRFWNPSHLKTYFNQVKSLTDEPPASFLLNFPERQIEHLKIHESLTDFCYTHLRTSDGVTSSQLKLKYPKNISTQVLKRFDQLCERGKLVKSESQWKIPPSFLPQSDEVFRELTFLADEL